MVSFTVRNLSRPANLAIPGRREGLQFMLAFGAGYGLVWLCTRVISKMKVTGCFLHGDLFAPSWPNLTDC
jgi:hypothetical protein